jgi:small subunit ribosomal protein S17
VVERRSAHPFYGKAMTSTKKYHAHDEKNEFKVGDVVRIVETRPLSKTKRWRVQELIERPE